MRLGIILGLGKDPDAALRRVHELGLPTCQVHPGDMDDAAVAAVRKATDRYSVEITSCAFPDSVPDIVMTNILAKVPN